MFLALLSARSPGCDHKDDPDCKIGYIPIVVFCISSLFTAIGVSGHEASLSSVQEQEKSIQTERDQVIFASSVRPTVTFLATKPTLSASLREITRDLQASGLRLLPSS
jgi:Na+-transporting NADH:ubiquinone oxidoreductase subunit NqrC